MGHLNTPDEWVSTIEWGENYRLQCVTLPRSPCLSQLRQAYYHDLKQYFALCGIARSKTAPPSMVKCAYNRIFRVRVMLEKSIQKSLARAFTFEDQKPCILFEGDFYGSSKKQGISVRMPLTSCNPTALCAGACYAHDVLDAAPNAVIRGAVNGIIAELFEGSDAEIRRAIMKNLHRYSKRAISNAKREADRIEEGWSRRPHIRFSHVGEITAYPQFANALARQIYDLSAGTVDCVVYTRHQRAQELDADLFVINFTLDKSSESRQNWAPPQARIVYSAFGGHLSASADVNFLEHHRWFHANASGNGFICPTTLPATKVRTCDAVQCNRCFVQPQGGESIP